MYQKRGSLSDQGCYGYVLAMLTAGYCLESRTEKERELLGSLSTKNWAYLVNERALLERKDAVNEFPVFDLEGEENNDIGEEDNEADIPDADLEHLETPAEKVRERVYRFVPRDLQNDLFVPLFRREKTEISVMDELFFQPSDSLEKKFHCWTYFPHPCDDFLFYVGLAGYPNSPGLRVRKDGELKRVSTAKLIAWVLGDPNTRTTTSANSRSPDWEYEEMLVTAAFMTACNSQSLRPCSLEDLLTRFVAELIDADKLYIELKTVDKIKWKGKFEAPFMFPYNAPMPKEINELLGTLNSTRPANKMQFDAGTYVPSNGSMNKLLCLIEVKSVVNASPKTARAKIHDALSRQDSRAKVGFIVLDQSIRDVEDFDLAKYRVLNRSKYEGSSYSKGGLMQNARLYKVGIENKKVVLTEFDGRNSEKAERLIFVISRNDINEQCRDSKI